MSLFQSYKFNWKQLGIFKLALLSIGGIAGAYFADFVKDYLVLFVVVAVVSTIYVIFAALKQHK